MVCSRFRPYILADGSKPWWGPRVVTAHQQSNISIDAVVSLCRFLSPEVLKAVEVTVPKWKTSSGVRSTFRLLILLLWLWWGSRECNSIVA